MDPTHLARNTPGMGLKDIETQVDMAAMRAHRLGRVQEQIAAHDCGAALLFGAVNVRYATGTRFAQVYNLHSPFRSAFVPTAEKVIMHDWERGYRGARALNTIAEVRDALTFTYFPAGERFEEVARAWAGEIAELMRAHADGNRRLAVDIIEPVAMHALMAEGIEVVSAEEIMEHAKAIKSADELSCICATISVAETGLARMRRALEAGMTENELWAILHHANISAGGEWIEYRLLASGGRTNPWMQECSDRVIRAGELVGCDTGMVGPWGYCADISRTFFCGPGTPTDEQRRLYRLACENIAYNLELVRPGASFREIADRTWPLPEEFVANRYSMAMHGIGMTDEWPSIPYPMDWDRVGYDGELRPGMTLCVESYLGAEGGVEGVKLEQMVAVTKDGYQLLSTFPFEDELLA